MTRKLLVLLLLLSAVLKAQEDDSLLLKKRLLFLSDNKRKTTLDSLVDRLVTPFMQTPQNCGISIGVSKNGTFYFYNYGEIQRGSGQLPSPATVYEIGSMTATFCGMLLAQAVVEHKVKLGDDIRNYLPGKYPNLTFDKTPIQLKHLANHTSGLPSVPEDLMQQPDFDSLNPYKNYDAKKIYAYLNVVHLPNEPGVVCDYSSFGIALLGLILEKVYDKPFDELVREKICVPNQLKATALPFSSLGDRQLATGYNPNGESTPAWDLGAFEAAGGLRSSAGDMISFLNYNLQEKDEAVRLSHTPTFSGRQTLGLGWFIKKTQQGNTLLWHNGATYGFAGFCGALKGKNSSVVILCNSATSVDYMGIAILNYLQQ